MHEQAYPVSEIVKATRVSEGLVRRLIREHQAILDREHAARDAPRRQPHVLARERKARKMRAAGLSFREIAKRLGVNESTIAKPLRGVPRKVDGAARVVERRR